MARQRELNLGFVFEHEKLRRNTNAYWGPEMAPFTYMTSHWGVESSREGSPDPNLSKNQIAPTTDSSVSIPVIHAGTSRGVLLSMSCSPSPPLLPTRKPPMLPFSRVIGAECCSRRMGQKGLPRLVKTLSSSHKESLDSLASQPRVVRSLSPLEYAEDEPMGEPAWSKDLTQLVSSPHFNHLGKWLADVNLGNPPSDEEQAQERFGIGWSSQEEREELEVQEDFDNSEIGGLIRTHVHRPPRR